VKEVQGMSSAAFTEFCLALYTISELEALKEITWSNENKDGGALGKCC